MYCDNCDQLAYSTNTTYRVTKKGKSVTIRHCSECGAAVETEQIKGTTIRIKNKRSR